MSSKRFLSHRFPNFILTGLIHSHCKNYLVIFFPTKKYLLPAAHTAHADVEFYDIQLHSLSHHLRKQLLERLLPLFASCTSTEGGNVTELGALKGDAETTPNNPIH